MGIRWRIVRVVGRRPFLTFGLVTLLVGAMLATVNLTSRYAIKLYVDDQLARTPWDVVVYQRAPAGRPLQLITERIDSLQGIERLERVVFLRALFPEGGEVVAEVDGRRLGESSWLCVLAASDLSVLPPEVGFALGQDATDGAVIAVTGPQQLMGEAFQDMQGARQFAVNVSMLDGRRGLFETPIRKVIRLERDELLRWLMDQTGSVSYVPHVGLFLLMPYREDVFRRFDTVANGILPLEMADPTDTEADHVQRAEYYPEVMYLAKLDRAALIDTWNLAASLQRVRAMHGKLEDTAADPSVFTIDSTTEVLLERMDGIARVVGVLTLFVALPLLWMAWMLASSLAGLLMLNERRTLGLMRLRGIRGSLLGQCLLLSMGIGGLAGAVLGVVLGSIVPLLIYEGGRLRLDVLLDRQQVLPALVFIVVSLLLALAVGWRLVRYATTISPLEASRRVADSEARHMRVSFGILQALALLAGVHVLARWIWHYSLVPWLGPRVDLLERLLDFIGLPLLLYGLARLVASRPDLMQRLLMPLVRPTAGVLGHAVVRHIAVKPHRTSAFLLIVALMTSVSLYPTITGRSFEDRAARGARVQVGGDWQLIFNAPDVAGMAKLEGTLADQARVLGPGLRQLTQRIEAIPGVAMQTHLVEGVLSSLYLPGYGLKGVPVYLVNDPATFTARAYSEPEVGLSAAYADVMARLSQGDVVTSTLVADFWGLRPGDALMLGRNRARESMFANTGGTLAFLPGLPPRSVTDRQGYVQARVDYLNHVFNRNSYLVATLDNAQLADLHMLVSRVIVLVKGQPGAAAGLERSLVASLPITPLEVHSIDSEVAKLGSDMYIALALATMRIYVVGGLLLALIAIVAIGLANHAEDRRTLGLLRIRGASPMLLWRFLVALLMAPAVLGLLIGTGVALAAGFGLASHVWELREIKTVVQYLPTRLAVSPATGLVMIVIVSTLLGAASAFSWWEYRRAAREGVRA